MIGHILYYPEKKNKRKTKEGHIYTTGCLLLLRNTTEDMAW